MEKTSDQAGSGTVRVAPIEDGGNPRTAADIRRTADGFVIAPFSEDGDANYKFRMDVALESDSEQAVPVRFVMEWGDEEYSKYRRYVLLSQGESWQRIPALVSGTAAAATVEVPPGKSRLGMHPPYDVAKLDEFLKGLDRKVFRVESIGKSRLGRSIFAVGAGREEARPLLLMSRVHPYESVGSFMVDGMMRWLGEGAGESRDLLARQSFVFVPMPNPDGVAVGNCKRTTGGLDVNMAAGSDEPEGVALSAFVRRIRPAATFDIHGFMHDCDGFGTSDIAKGDAMRDRLLARPDLFNKKLGVRHSPEPEGGTSNLGGMAEHEMGSVRFGGSWAWYGRDAKHLRAMGVEILKAYAAQFGL